MREGVQMPLTFARKAGQLDELIELADELC